jgi:hypothetical protein
MSPFFTDYAPTNYFNWHDCFYTKAKPIAINVSVYLIFASSCVAKNDTNSVVSVLYQITFFHKETSGGIGYPRMLAIPLGLIC